MRYYSEEDVISIMRAVEASVMAYEWGCGNTDVNLEDYPSIEIPEPHDMVMWNDVENAPTIIKSSNSN